MKGNQQGIMNKKMVLSLTWYAKEMVLERTHLKWKGAIGNILEG
jgi:hypothetical protein